MKFNWCKCIQIILLIIFTYCGIAMIVFEYRNPLSNDLAFIRDFKSVMTFKRLPQYQIIEKKDW